MGIAVGIDLGTTNSCVGVVQADRAKVVADRMGRRIHPSIVSYLPDGSVQAGYKARERLIIDPENTAYSFKRLLGRDFTSGEMQKILADLPYEVHLGPGDIPALKVQEREVSLPEVSAMMLKHLRTMCSESLGIDIKEAVITVPANFNDVQRSSTKVAGRIAGFNVLRILNEPTAAALAYGVGTERSERIAIYDFGGGTFDITIVEVSDDIFEVLSTAGDTFLGGDDFDKVVLEEMRAGFERKHDVDLSQNKVAMQRMRTVAEQVKCQLSTIEEVQATLRQIAHNNAGIPVDFDFKLDKARFEGLTGDLVARSLSVCDEAMKLAGIDKTKLDALILVGGTTRVPIIRNNVTKHFGMEPRAEINPDEVVAIGAAIQAFSLTGEQMEEELDLPAPAAPPKTKRKSVSTLPPEPLTPKRPSNMPSSSPTPMPVSPIPGGPIALAPEPSPSEPTAPKRERPFPSKIQSMDRPSVSPAKPAKKKKETLPQKNEPEMPELQTEEPPVLEPAIQSGEPPLLEPEPIAAEPEPVALEPDVSENVPEIAMEDPDDLLVGATNLESIPETAAPVKEPSDAWPAVLGTPSAATLEDPAFSEGAGEGDSESWFGVLNDLPISEDGAAAEETVSQPPPAVPDLGDPLDALSDLAPPPASGSMPPPPPLSASKPPLPPAVPEAKPSPPEVPEEFPSPPPLLDSVGSVDGADEVPVEFELPDSEPPESYPIPSKPALLLDVTPRALGVATAGGFHDIIIERNAAIPVEQSRLFTTSTDNQTEVAVDIYQGEDKRIEDNTKLGEILLTNLRPAHRGEIKIKVTFEIDTDGILGVSAKNEETNEAQSTRIALTGSMDEDKVEELVQKYSE